MALAIGAVWRNTSQSAPVNNAARGGPISSTLYSRKDPLATKKVCLSSSWKLIPSLKTSGPRLQTLSLGALTAKSRTTGTPIFATSKIYYKKSWVKISKHSVNKTYIVRRREVWLLSQALYKPKKAIPIRLRIFWILLISVSQNISSGRSKLSISNISRRDRITQKCPWVWEIRAMVWSLKQI